MPAVNSINSTSQYESFRRRDNKEKREQVAAGVGGAAGITASATNMAGKNGIRAKEGTNAIHQMMDSVTKTTKTVNQNLKATEGLFGTFKSNVKMYANDIMKHLETLKTNKFVAKIIDSPITKVGARFFGGALAFFVLVTGVNKAVDTGKIAFGDFKNKYNEYNS